MLICACSISRTLGQKNLHGTMLRRPAHRCLAQPVSVAVWIPRRSLINPRKPPSGRAVEKLNLEKLYQKSQDYHRNRRVFLMSGACAGIIAFIYTAWKLRQALREPSKSDFPLGPDDPLSSDGRKIVIHDDSGHEVVTTGNSTVPTFPRTLQLPIYNEQEAHGQVVRGSTSEYTLVGLGLRTVTFLSIQVYLVGYYIATADIAAFQAALVKKVNPIASALVPSEREDLRAALLDPAEGERIWDELLHGGIPARSVFRIVPVRDTDFHHLRDGFVRAIQGRVGKDQDDGFGETVRQFRELFNRGRVPKSKELLLIRDEKGSLLVAYDDGSKIEGQPAGRQLVGVVEDGRITHALWMNYLAGKTVASEPARKNIVEGIMEFVERPLGTVASQVV